MLTACIDVLFSIVYLAVYHPFSSSESFWLSLSDARAGVYSMLFYLVSFLWLLLTKYLLHLSDRKHNTTIRKLLFFFVADFLGVSLIYLAFTFFTGNAGGVGVFELLIRSLLCVLLILGIPFAFCLMYAFIQDRNEEIALLKLNTLPEKGNKTTQLVSLADYSGAVKISALPEEIYYLESQDNYVNIHYMAGDKMNSYLLRNTTAGIEDAFRGTVIVRCHRSFIVNIAHIKVIKHEKGKATVVMDDNVGTVIPVSKSYYKELMNILVQYKEA